MFFVQISGLCPTLRQVGQSAATHTLWGGRTKGKKTKEKKLKETSLSKTILSSAIL